MGSTTQIDLPEPTNRWNTGRYITINLPLALPKDAPAGKYHLVIGLYNPANGQRLAMRTLRPLRSENDGPDALPLMHFYLLH